MVIFEGILIFLIPSFVLFLCKNYKLFKKIDAILLCYLLGFVLSFFIGHKYKVISQDIASIIVMIAIPLILFSFNISDFKKLVKTTIIAFVLMVVSVMLVSAFAGIIAYKNGLEYGLKLAGMSTGLYIGGTPNMFAIGEALLKDINIINIANICDSLIGGIYIIVIIAFGKKIYGCLPGKKETGIYKEKIKENNDRDFTFLKDKQKLKKAFLMILLSAFCVGAGVLIEILVNGNMNGSLFIVLTVSVLGILFSLFPNVRNTEGNYQIGQYLILVFSFALSLSIDFGVLKANMLPVLLYFAVVQFSSIILHFVLCVLFKIDGGTALITSIAGIYGPPFIAPVAKAYDDDELIMPGVICGVLGLAIGNILGISLASLLLMLI